MDILLQILQVATLVCPVIILRRCRKGTFMLSDEVYDQLLDLLGSGAWPKGSRLPSEHELARRFAVSRPILRQALVRLRAEGRLYS